MSDIRPQHLQNVKPNDAASIPTRGLELNFFGIIRFELLLFLVF